MCVLGRLSRFAIVLGFVLLCVVLAAVLFSCVASTSGRAESQGNQSIEGTLYMPNDTASMDVRGQECTFATEARFDLGQSDIDFRGFSIDGGVMVRTSGMGAWKERIAEWHNGELVELCCEVALSAGEAAAMRAGESNGDEVHKMRFQLWQKLIGGTIAFTDNQGVVRTYRIEPKTSIESWKDLRAISSGSGLISIALVPEALSISDAAADGGR